MLNATIEELSLWAVRLEKAMKKEPPIQVMGFFRRFFSKKNQDNEIEATFEESEEEILEEEVQEQKRPKLTLDLNIENPFQQDEDESLDGESEISSEEQEAQAMLK